jgi:hypothetical protein
MTKKEVRQTTIQKRDDYIHIETPLGIVNIYPGLHDQKGRRVDRIEMLPNDHYAGERIVKRIGDRFVETNLILRPKR